MSEIANKSESFREKIIKLQDNYYSIHSKNSLFKKSQKIDCAKYISESFELNDLIDNTIFVIPDTNRLYIDYTILKLYANLDNCEKIIDHIMNIFKYIIEYYNNYEVFLNLDSFTVSAAERYKDIIKMFFNKCLSESTQFVMLLTKFNILNIPSVMELIIKIFKPFADPIVIERIHYYTKEESAQFIESLALN
jgi:hypothetical protein